MISIAIGLGFLVIVASVYILKLSFEIRDLRSDIATAAVKQQFLVDYIDSLSKQLKKAKSSSLIIK
jgi:hypothetical protein